MSRKAHRRSGKWCRRPGSRRVRWWHGAAIPTRWLAKVRDQVGPPPTTPHHHPRRRTRAPRRRPPLASAAGAPPTPHAAREDEGCGAEGGACGQRWWEEEAGRGSTRPDVGGGGRQEAAIGDRRRLGAQKDERNPLRKKKGTARSTARCVCGHWQAGSTGRRKEGGEGGDVPATCRRTGRWPAHQGQLRWWAAVESKRRARQERHRYQWRVAGGYPRKRRGWNGGGGGRGGRGLPRARGRSHAPRAYGRHLLCRYLTRCRRTRGRLDRGGGRWCPVP